MNRLRVIVLTVSAVVCLAAGCSPYVASVIQGELELLAQTVPIESALEDPALSDEQKARLAFVIAARDYAGEVVGLNVARNYQTFVNLGNEPLAWNLSASRKDAFEPYYWTLPIAGRIPYLGFFELDQALAERDRLVGLGYDTMIYELDAYSTFGVLPDPVISSLLRRNLTSLADTVFHELTHSTIISGSTNFDESVATFVGRTAAIEFLGVTFGPASAEVSAATVGYADQDRHQAFLRALIDELQAVYASELSYEEKLARRQEVIQAAQQRYAAEVLPLLEQPDLYRGFTTFSYNNAYLLAHVRYNQGQDLFARVHEQTGRAWPETLRLFARAARAPAPFEELRGLLEQP